MTEKEAIETIKHAMEQSEQIIIELTNIQSLAERQQMVGEYYAELKNYITEIEACKVAIKALTEIQKYKQYGTAEECEKAIEVKKAVTKIVDGQLIAGKNNYKETNDCFYKIVKIIQDNY